MFKKIAAPAFAVLAFVLFCWACSKPTSFGGDLLDDQLADYDYTDTLSMVITQEREDTSIITNDRNTTEYFLCGELNDPKLGKSTAEIFAMMQTSNSAINFQNGHYRYDSLIMYLKLNASGIYGDTLQEQHLKIYRLNQTVDTKDSSIYYSNNTLAAGDLVGELNFFPKPSNKDSLISTTAKGAYVKIKLNDSFGQELFGYDSLTYSADSSFERHFRGLKIVSSTGSNPGAMLALTLNDANFSLMRMFYSKDDTIKGAFAYQFLNAKKFVHLSHNYSGAEVEPRIGQKTTDFIYAQGMAGLRCKIEFPTAASLDNIAVNKAELVLTVANQASDNILLYPSRQMIATSFVNDTTFAILSDVQNSIGTTGSDGYGRFGGFPEKRIVNGQEVTQVRFTLTQHFQDIIDNVSSDPNKRSIWLSIAPQFRTSSRIIFYGPGSTVYPPKLEMKYTKVR